MKELNDDLGLFQRLPLPGSLTHVAPDTSEIRVLFDIPGAGLAHCKLVPGQTSRGTRHKTVSEIWFVLSGVGEIWQGKSDRNDFTRLFPGLCLTVPVGNSFQFRNSGNEDLDLLIVTSPNWPGPGEAIKVKGYWQFKMNRTAFKNRRKRKL